jgi:hypothetical protein
MFTILPILQNRLSRQAVDNRSISNMNPPLFWTLTQLGLLLEITGAVYIALSSISMHKRIERLFFDIWGFREIPRIVATMQNQTTTDIRGFILLAVGLMLQFAGNLEPVLH